MHLMEDYLDDGTPCYRLYHEGLREYYHAKEELADLNIVQSDEMAGVRKTLDAAAWTYVAAFVASLGNLLYLLSILQRR